MNLFSQSIAGLGLAMLLVAPPAYAWQQPDPQETFRQEQAQQEMWAQQRERQQQQQERYLQNLYRRQQEQQQMPMQRQLNNGLLNPNLFR